MIRSFYVCIDFLLLLILSLVHRSLLSWSEIRDKWEPMITCATWRTCMQSCDEKLDVRDLLQRCSCHTLSPTTPHVLSDNCRTIAILPKGIVLRPCYHCFCPSLKIEGKPNVGTEWTCELHFDPVEMIPMCSNWSNLESHQEDAAFYVKHVQRSLLKVLWMWLAWSTSLQHYFMYTRSASMYAWPLQHVYMYKWAAK